MGSAYGICISLGNTANAPCICLATLVSRQQGMTTSQIWKQSSRHWQDKQSHHIVSSQSSVEMTKQVVHDEWPYTKGTEGMGNDQRLPAPNYPVVGPNEVVGGDEVYITACEYSEEL